MYLETHLKKKPAMLRKDAKKKGGGPKPKRRWPM